MPEPELKTLGRYRLDRVLGKGAMGVVYEGFDPRLGRKVAVKTILQSHLDATTAKDYSSRFEREAQAVARLNHPNIVHIHDFGHEGDVSYLVMEFINGKELKSFFDAHHPFDLNDVVRIMRELCDALDFAHQAGVIHRDIKPGNVMLDARNRVKLTDFGVARLQDSTRSQVTQAGTMVGTPAYMSPEQISGAVVDGRSDVFSTGIILYQFLTGAMPFGGGGAWTIAKKIMQDDPPPPSSLNAALPPHFDLVVRKALAKKPSDRYQSAAELGSALREVLENRGTPLHVPVSAAPQPSADSAEAVFWNSIKESKAAQEFKLYLEQYPEGIYAELARRAVAKLDAEAKERAWRETVDLARRQDELESGTRPTPKGSRRHVMPLIAGAILLAAAAAYTITQRSPEQSAKVEAPQPQAKPPAPAEETRTVKSTPAPVDEPRPTVAAESVPPHPSLKFFIRPAAANTADYKQLLEATDAYLHPPRPQQQERLRGLVKAGNDFAALVMVIRQHGVSREEAAQFAARLAKNNVSGRLRKLSDARDDLATYWLARMTYEPTLALDRVSNSKDMKERKLVFGKLVASAERGYIPAQVQLASYNSYFIEESDAELVKERGMDPAWVKTRWVGDVRKTLPGVLQAAELGYVAAQALLGDVYGQGREETRRLAVAQDVKRGIAWTEKAMEQGAPEDYPPVAQGLASLLLMQPGSATDPRALALISQASEMGSSWAKIYLAYLYANGRRVPKDLARARTHLLEASRLEGRIRMWGQTTDLIPPMDHRIDGTGMRVPDDFEAYMDRGHGADLFSQGQRQVAIKDFVFEGNTVFTQSRLKQAMALPPTGSYSASELNEKLGRVRAFYRQNGNFLAQVYVPKQQLSNGVLRVLVWEGRIEKAVVEQADQGRCMPEGVVDGFVKQTLPPGLLITEPILEVPMLALNDGLPCQVSSEIRPGSKEGFANLKILLKLNTQSPLR